ncbi:MAG: hypothetical protein KHW93_01295 [Butyricicoccus pullicaecorum]|nr:hypothetical protein [Butyricicoccus pullicaecorum]
MKKTVSLLLCLSMVMGLSVPAFAASEPVTHEEIITLRNIGHGEYALVEDSLTAQMSDDAYITATATQDSEIYHYEGNQYLVRNGNGNFMLNEKVDIDTTAFSNNTVLFDTYDIPVLVQEEIKSVMDAQAAIGNDDLEISIYSSVTESGSYSHTYNGKSYTLKDYTTDFRDLHMGPLSYKGSNTWNIAKQVGDFIISKTENISDIVKIFGKFATAYDVATALFGELHTGSTKDEFRIDLVYDRLQKATYVYNTNLGGYQPGCVSHKVWIDTAAVYVFYNGEQDADVFTVNKEFFSPNYKKPGDTAVKYSGDNFYTDPYLYTTFLGNKLSFSGIL